MMQPHWRTRVRPVRQMEAAECGVACLTMVLDFFGHAAPLATVRELCGTSRDGNSALDLLKAARQLSLSGRGLKVPLHKLNTLHRPAILHWDLNHFVVLEAARKNGSTIVDPAVGRRFVALAELDRKYTGIALELQPSEGFVRRSRATISYTRYCSALLRARRTLAFVVVANLTGQALALTFPAASQILIDHVISPARDQWLVPVLATMALGAFGQISLVTLLGSSQALLGATLGLNLTTELGHRLLSVPLPFLDSRSRGDLLERVRLQGTLQVLVARIAQAGFELVFVVFVGCLMLAYDLGLGLVSFAMLALRIVVIRLLRAPAQQRFAAELAASGQERAALVEATTSPEMIKGLGIESTLVERYARRVIRRAGCSIASERLAAGVGASLSVLGGLMEATILWYGGGRVIGGEMTVGEFAGFLTLRAMVEVPIGGLVSLFENSIELRGALERTDDILSVPVAPPGFEKTGSVVGRIELRDVGFRYGSGGPWVLKNVNLVICPGERVAIVGPSGQGKSTLAKLVCGLLEPTEGDVLLDGKPIANYDRRWLAEQFGVVLQDPLIWEGAVKDVLALRVPDAPFASLQLAAKCACVDEVIQRLPGRYDSALSENGSNLSGGERQRLALAQSLVGNPHVLLLDEATSALDPETERRVLDHLDSLPATIVSVAHRASAIARAERIFTVAGGCVSQVQDTGRTNSARQQPCGVALSICVESRILAGSES